MLSKEEEKNIEELVRKQVKEDFYNIIVESFPAFASLLEDYKDD